MATYTEVLQGIRETAGSVEAREFSYIYHKAKANFRAYGVTRTRFLNKISLSYAQSVYGGLQDASVIDFDLMRIAKRFQEFATKYPDAQIYIDQYMTGQITIQELSDRIQYFKRVNAKYLARAYRYQ